MNHQLKSALFAKAWADVRAIPKLLYEEKELVLTPSTRLNMWRKWLSTYGLRPRWDPKYRDCLTASYGKWEYTLFVADRARGQATLSIGLWVGIKSDSFLAAANDALLYDGLAWSYFSADQQFRIGVDLDPEVDPGAARLRALFDRLGNAVDRVAQFSS